MNSNSTPVSVMTYSHDGFGLGHMRRNANIASRFARDVPDANVLMVVGCSSGVTFDLPDGVDFLKLPSIVKVGTNQWAPRSLRMSADRTRELRTALIERAAELFRPDLFLVDHVPAGVWGELVPLLKSFRDMANPPKVVLGLRDILDAPDVVQGGWVRDGVYDLIERYYDEVFVYGSRSIFDTAAAYGLDRLDSGKINYCGYLCAEDASGAGDSLADRNRTRAALGVGREKLVVVVAGGGHDAHPMMTATLNAFHHLGAADCPNAVVVAGPLMPAGQRADLERQAEGLPVRVLRSVPDYQSHLNAADLVVTMGGYNTLMEALFLGKPTLVIPRLGPSAEQKIRARVLASRGLVTAIEPEDATPETVATAIRELLDGPPVSNLSLGANGLNNVVRHMSRLLDLDAPRSPAAHIVDEPALLRTAGGSLAGPN